MGPWVWALARYALILVTRKCVLVLMQYLFLYLHEKAILRDSTKIRDFSELGR